MSNRSQRRAVPAGLAIALMLALVAPAHAQQNPSAELLTPEQALQTAIAQNPALRAAILDWRRARLQVVSEDYQFVPDVFAEAGYTTGRRPSQGTAGVSLLTSDSLRLSTGLSKRFRWGTQVSTAIDVERAVQDSVVLGNLGETYGLGLVLELAQPLLRGFGTDVVLADLHVAELQQDAALIQRDQAASTLARDVLDAYWNLWYAEQQLDITQSALELSNTKLDEANQRLKVGLVSEADLIPLQTELARLQENLTTSQAAIEENALELARLLGMQPAQADWRTVEQAPEPHEAPSLDQALAAADERSYELRQLGVNVDVAGVQAEVADNLSLPQLDATASVELSGLGGDVPDAFDQITGFRGVTGFVGLRLDLPITDRGLQAEAERAELAVDAARARYASAADRVHAQVASALSNFEAARQRLVLAQRTADLSAKQVEVQSTLFDNGKATMLDVVTAIQDQNEAKLRVARARLDMLQLRYALEDLTGTLLERLSVAL